MDVGYLQYEPLFGQTERNLAAIERLAAGLPRDGLVVLPELATSGYTFVSRDEAMDLAEPFDCSPSLDRLQATAVERSCAIVVGFPERDGDRIFNSSALLRADGTRERYRKIHLYAAENEWFSPGDRQFEVHEVNGVPVGMMICFDWFFPEAARALALRGALVICQPANLVLPWCQAGMVTRSIENRVFTITANRVGAEERPPFSNTFTGMSQITGPRGEILLRAPEHGEALEICSIDPGSAARKRLNDWNDLFGSRRPEFYGDLCR
jgi:predicted amidohydrolase